MNKKIAPFFRAGIQASTIVLAIIGFVAVVVSARSSMYPSADATVLALSFINLIGSATGLIIEIVGVCFVCLLGCKHLDSYSREMEPIAIPNRFVN